MAYMTVEQLKQAAKNPKRRAWTDEMAQKIHEIEVFRVTCKRRWQKCAYNPYWVVDHLNDNHVSYARMVHMDDDEIIFDWIVASCCPNYFSLWDYLEKNLREYRVEKITND